MLNIEGERYGRLTAIKPTEKRTKGGGVIWLFRCDCGNEKEIPLNSVRSNLIKSCGCLLKPHGETKTRIHRIWVNMRMRCKHEGQKHWHDKGIMVCEEWKDYITFRDWALSNGYAEDLTLDRIDSDGDYCPENCRWVSYAVQSRNTSHNHFVEIGGVKKIVPDWCKELGTVSRASVYRRVRDYGWSFEKALLEPKRKPYGIKDNST